MKTWLVNWWDTFRSGFWFIPTLSLFGAMFFAWLMPTLDRQVVGDFEDRLGAIVSTASAARLSLSSIAGALITMTGVVFSITLVTLSTTATQFGSRLLRTMMDDRMTQLALGCMLGTSLYCLLILRVIENTKEFTFVPHLSIGSAIAFTVLSLGVFIAFIHHIGVRLQAPNLIHSVALELHTSVDRLFPEQLGSGADDVPVEVFRAQLAAQGTGYEEVKSEKDGYLQAVDAEGLMYLACTKDIVVYVKRRPGEFVSPGVLLARVWPRNTVDEELLDAIRAFFLVGISRTPRQDVECAMNELVEIAVRALSPGINDPFTAMTCLDYLGVFLGRFAGRSSPSPLREDEDGKVRAFTEPVTFRVLLDGAFRMILHCSQANAVVLERMMTALETIQPALRRKADREALQEFLVRVCDSCESHLRDERDRANLTKRCEELQQRIRETV